MKEFEYFRPSTLKEALELLKTYGSDAALLNGGTDLIVRMREGHSEPAAIIDIKHIDSLKSITIDSNKITIGACVLLNELGENAIVKKNAPFLAQAALSVGSKQVRNRATCIGNICNASPLADTATPLLALDAVVNIYSEEGIREIPLKDFFVFVRKTVLKADEIVTGISFNLSDSGKGIFTKISRRKEVDLSTVCGTIYKSEKGYRACFGAVAPTPVRLYRVEEFLDKNTLSEAVIEEACEIARGEVSPISDIRASMEYRQEMVTVVITRALKEWL